jgi:NCS1 family nucleobase:cation symporter-1
MASTEHPPAVELPAPGEYGDKVVAVEPGGIEPVPEADKHGRPSQLLWTWASPNLEFATVFVGALAVFAFGLTFWQAVFAVLVGNLLGAVTHAVLSARGPRYGVPQMVLSRLGFGYWGNLLPAGLNAVMAGVGWFAVNSVSGAFALSSLTGLPTLLCLVVIVVAQLTVAFFGHNLVHAFERYALPLLAVVFLIGTVVMLARSSPSTAAGGGGTGGFLLTASAAFGYTAGWNPYAADYTRYLPATVSRRAAGIYAGLGVFLSCTVLMIAGAASVTAGADYTGNPTTAYTGELPAVLSHLTLLCVALGAVAANAINVYSGALSFLCMNVGLSLAWRRAIVALGFGAVGFVLAWTALPDAGHDYESFLLVIAYWVAPWLAVVLLDQWLYRGRDDAPLLGAPAHRNWAGPIAMLAGLAGSVALFSNQQLYTGPVPEALPSLGDVTPLVGFVVAGLLYLVLRPLRPPAA